MTSCSSLSHRIDSKHLTLFNCLQANNVVMVVVVVVVAGGGGGSSVTAM